jgi:hypothetical protein
MGFLSNWDISSIKISHVSLTSNVEVILAVACGYIALYVTKDSTRNKDMTGIVFPLITKKYGCCNNGT